MRKDLITYFKASQIKRLSSDSKYEVVLVGAMRRRQNSCEMAGEVVGRSAAGVPNCGLWLYNKRPAGSQSRPQKQELQTERIEKHQLSNS